MKQPIDLKNSDMEKGKLYRHVYPNKKDTVIVLCTGEGAVDSTKVFAGTVVKVTGKCGDKVGDHASYFAISMFEPYKKKIII